MHVDHSFIHSFRCSARTASQSPCSPVRAGEVRELLLDWIVDSCRPLSTIADPGLVHALLASWSKAIRSRVERILRAPSQKRHVPCTSQKELVELITAASVTKHRSVRRTVARPQSDISSMHGPFHKPSSRLMVSAVLQMPLFHARHTSVRIEEHFSQRLNELSVPRTALIAVTHDEVANMVSACTMRDR